QTALDVNGAYSARFSSGVAAAAITIPANISSYRITLVAGATANACTATSPQDGQHLVIINEDDDAATFATYAIAAVSAGIPGVGSFIYNSGAGAWRQVSSTPSSASASTGWSTTGNSGTT